MNSGCTYPRRDEVIHEIYVDSQSFDGILTFRKLHLIVPSEGCYEAEDRIMIKCNNGTNAGNECLVAISYVERIPGVNFNDRSSIMPWTTTHEICVLSIKVETWALPNAEARGE